MADIATVSAFAMVVPLYDVTSDWDTIPCEPQFECEGHEVFRWNVLDHQWVSVGRYATLGRARGVARRTHNRLCRKWKVNP